MSKITVSNFMVAKILVLRRRGKEAKMQKRQQEKTVK
jgi:hypothetical protein